MIPIIIIGAKDYSDYTNAGRVLNIIEMELPYEDDPDIDIFAPPCEPSLIEEIKNKNEDIRGLRKKVFTLLHEEVAGLSYENAIGCIIPACFQIKLSDVIAKAKGEKK